MLCVAPRGTPQPVIDVHMHAVGPAGLRAVAGNEGLATEAAILDNVRAQLTRSHVVAVVLTGQSTERMLQWAQRDSRFVRSVAFRDTTVSLDSLRALYRQHDVRAFGELGFQYSGYRPDDPVLDRYFALAEELDVPVAIHMAGSGMPDVPTFRVRLGDPLLLEEVLVRHPKLRVNVMHAGLPFLENMIALMRRYANVYADLSMIDVASAYPREQFHDYLRALIRAGFGARLMYGSDAAGPGTIAASIDGITSASFLSDAEKRKILCDNAARFFRLGVSAAGTGRTRAVRF